jgi:hypothetical protein
LTIYLDCGVTRFSPKWVIAYFRQLIESYRSIAHIWATYFILWISIGINFDKNGLGHLLGVFSQTHLVTLLDRLLFTRRRVINQDETSRRMQHTGHLKKRHMKKKTFLATKILSFLFAQGCQIFQYICIPKWKNMPNDFKKTLWP